ncbi:MAG: hypothetical protein KGJ77_11175, partial [Acidobacteriota bacterium]|nr:hypothetical protein [Acidobacteriota bacterium]
MAGDVAGVGWTVLAAFAVLAPALRPGYALGPYDLLSRFGLTGAPGVSVHNPAQADVIQQFVPWTRLAWQQVHAGQVPLWNPFSILGMPLAFNWQSAPFSLPMAVSYLFPLHVAFTVVVLTKLVVAGTGAYVLCRVLGTRPLAAALGGTAFELSGPIIVHSQWSMVGVTAWTGWILAGVVLALRPRHRLGGCALLAVTLALAIYGGHPESLLIVGVSCAVFLVVRLASERRS